LEGLEGTIRGHWLGQFSDIDPEEIDALSASFTERAYSHTSLVFGRRLVMRLFRRLERGSLDVEMGTYLLEHDFDGAAPLTGHLDYHRGRWEPTTLVTIHEYIPHRSDGWSWFRQWAQSYYEQVRSDFNTQQKTLGDHSPAGLPSLGSLDLMRADADQILGNSDFHDFLEGARQLGRRIASLHRVLGEAEPGTPFEPLPLNTAYERARYQAMRSLLARAYRLLTPSTTPTIWPGGC
jgi:maltose alpha-D-glucosyltransferase / alpha-amylase